MMNNLLSFFPFLTDLNHQAGEIIRRYYGTQLEIDRKADQSPVTRADREVETRLRELIEGQFPDHSILGEEFGETKKSSGYRWIIDPIDGTQSFILRTPLFGTLIALECDGAPVLGSLYLPIQNQLMIGSAETGTFLNGVRCHVSQTAELSAAKLMLTDPSVLVNAEPHPGLNRLCRGAGLVRGFGDCYGYFLVACGVADVAVDPIVNYYDIAPLPPILAGAGGIFTDWDGGEAPLASNALATNRHLHEQALALLGAAANPEAGR
jgi:myo-inositol-1(or 4)-monophosphatase